MCHLDRQFPKRAPWKCFLQAALKEPPVELDDLYWPPVHAVLKNDCRNRLPTACIVCPYTSEFLIQCYLELFMKGNDSSNKKVLLLVKKLIPAEIICPR